MAILNCAKTPPWHQTNPFPWNLSSELRGKNIFYCKYSEQLIPAAHSLMTLISMSLFGHHTFWAPNSYTVKVLLLPLIHKCVLCTQFWSFYLNNLNISHLIRLFWTCDTEIWQMATDHVIDDLSYFMLFGLFHSSFVGNIHSFMECTILGYGARPTE